MDSNGFNLETDSSFDELESKKKSIEKKISKNLFTNFLNSSFLKKLAYGVTEFKNKKSMPWSKENLKDLIDGKIKYIEYGKYFRLYKDKQQDTLVFDITRNLSDLQKGSKKYVLEHKIADGLKNLVEDLKSSDLRSILGKFHYIKLTSWIFGSKNLDKDGNPRLRDVFVDNLAKKIPEIDTKKTQASKMKLIDIILTMGVYPHEFSKVWNYSSKGKIIIDIDKVS